jgi:hypothetical protein
MVARRSRIFPPDGLRALVVPTAAGSGRAAGGQGSLRSTAVFFHPGDCLATASASPLLRV